MDLAIIQLKDSHLYSSIPTTLYTNPTIQKPTHHHNLTPSSHSFVGLRRIPAAAKSIKPARPTIRPSTAIRAKAQPVSCHQPQHWLSLFLGRFVFFNFMGERGLLSEQNGKSHFEAGDSRAKEYMGLLKSNDPVGFNIVDVLAWGSIGHIVAYYILATSRIGYDPKFFS